MQIRDILFLICLVVFIKESHSISTIDQVGNEVPAEYPLKAALMYMVGKRVAIYHGTASKESLDGIVDQGLWSRRKFLERGSFDQLKAYFLRPSASNQEIQEEAQRNLSFCTSLEQSWVYDARQIYFSPEGSMFARYANLKMLVDPEKTYVFNTVYKLNIDANESLQNFVNSKVLLSDYLRYVEEARKMQQDRPDLKVCLHPLTARPYYLESGHQKKVTLYIAEIPFNAEIIPSKRLILVQDSEFGIRNVLIGEGPIEPILW